MNSMFCSDCGSLKRPFNGELICVKCDSKEAEELERSQESLVRMPGGFYRKRDTPADQLARRERTIGEFLDKLQSAHMATVPELRDMGLSPLAIVLLLKDGRAVNLHTNWTYRFPLNAGVQLEKFDFHVFAHTDNDPRTRTEWWFMTPKEVLLHWQLGDDQDGYLDADDLSTYHEQWERLQ